MWLVVNIAAGSFACRRGVPTQVLFLFLKYIFFWLHLVFCCCVWAFSSGKQGLFSTCSAWVSCCGGFFCEAPAPGLVDVSSCGSWAYLPRGMWDLPRPGKSRAYLFCTLSSIAKHLQLSSTINSQK